MAERKDPVRSGIYGLAIADAVGVPAEFHSREELKRSPITDMIGFGSHYQKPGTWSDDTSMALCLAYSLPVRGGIDPEDIMRRFADWMRNGRYSPDRKCFDIGNTCAEAIGRFLTGYPAEECGPTELNSNGNGSLMRILPLLYYLTNRYGFDFSRSDEAMKEIGLVSSLTHGHAIARSACGIYLCVCAGLTQGEKEKETAVRDGIREALAWYGAHEEYREGVGVWSRTANGIAPLAEEEIRSGGYVVDTLEAALWCFLNSSDYRECVLKAVNLGRDTDTTAAVAGGLAGLYYGYEGIPEAWREKLRGRELIETACVSLSAVFPMH